MRRSVLQRLLPVLALVAGLTACGDEPVTASSAALLDTLQQPKLLACPSNLPALSVTGPIGELGGTLAVGPLTLAVPEGAVPTSTLFALVVPPSQYLEVELNAVGLTSYVFQKPVTVTIDYSRCEVATGPGGAPLKVVQVHPLTRQVLEDMGGTMDPVARTVTFTTGHFSSYVVAY